MPDLSSFMGIFGILPISKDNAIQNHLILLWKFILFSNRDKANLDLFQIYKAKITCRSVYKIEYVIADKRGKLPTHLKNGENWYYYFRQK